MPTEAQFVPLLLQYLALVLSINAVCSPATRVRWLVFDLACQDEVECVPTMQTPVQAPASGAAPKPSSEGWTAFLVSRHKSCGAHAAWLGWHMLRESRQLSELLEEPPLPVRVPHVRPPHTTSRVAPSARPELQHSVGLCGVLSSPQHGMLQSAAKIFLIRSPNTTAVTQNSICDHDHLCLLAGIHVHALYGHLHHFLVVFLYLFWAWTLPPDSGRSPCSSHPQTS